MRIPFTRLDTMPELSRLSESERRHVLEKYVTSREAKQLLAQFKALTFTGLFIGPLGLLASGLARPAFAAFGVICVVGGVFLYRHRSRAIVKRYLH